MRILGIDPGLATVGYAVVEERRGQLALIEYGCIKTSPTQAMPERLAIIYKAMNEIIDEFEPNEMAIEELFFAKNVTNGIQVGQARGVEILAAQMKNVRVYEYTPMQVKLAVTGYGRADKYQMQENIRLLFKLQHPPKPDDAADAIGIAFTHAMSARTKEEYFMK